MEMIAPMLLKAAFKFLNTVAEEKSLRLKVILLWLSSSNSGLFAFFLQKCIWLNFFFFEQGRLFSLNGHLSLLSVKLNSVQKFIFG